MYIDNRIITPQYLQKGDKIGIMAPARKISREEVMPSIEIIRNKGYEVVEGKYLYEADNQFAGSDDMRAADLQQMIDDPEIKAVLFARGGYGSVRIIDKIDFSNFVNNPCWLAGYSDITVILNHVVRNFGVKTLHATMPINFSGNNNEALQSLFRLLEGMDVEYKLSAHHLNKPGKISGQLVGGNLSVLYSMLGSDSFPETDNRILFIEDLDEYLYHIDRMMIALKRAGKLENLKGLLVGAMTDMNDNAIPFGENAEEIISRIMLDYTYPLYYNIPSGHFDKNCALEIGGHVEVCKGGVITLKTT